MRVKQNITNSKITETKHFVCNKSILLTDIKHNIRWAPKSLQNRSEKILKEIISIVISEACKEN